MSEDDGLYQASDGIWMQIDQAYIPTDIAALSALYAGNVEEAIFQLEKGLSCDDRFRAQQAVGRYRR